MKRFPILLGALAAALVLATVPAAKAEARGCSGGGVTYNRSGQAAMFTGLDARKGMNCASARYVMRYLRKAYARQTRHRIPTIFDDGYVTWFCFRRSHVRWQCDEYDSNTQFRFIAYHY